MGSAGKVNTVGRSGAARAIAVRVGALYAAVRSAASLAVPGGAADRRNTGS
jgi:hypothetical protein